MSYCSIKIFICVSRHCTTLCRCVSRHCASCVAVCVATVSLCLTVWTATVSPCIAVWAATSPSCVLDAEINRLTADCLLFGKSSSDVTLYELRLAFEGLAYPFLYLSLFYETPLLYNIK